MLDRHTPARRHRWRRTLLLLTTAVAGACSGGGDDGSPTEPGGISVSASPTAATVTAGGTATFTVTVGRTGSFTGPVNLTVEGLPSGVTATVNPASVAAGATSATVTLNAAASAVAGPSALTVRATGTGVTAQSATVGLTVQAAQPVGAFTLALAPATLSVAAGGSATSTVTITRTGGFAGPVNLAVTGAPAGVTATVNPTSVAGNTATVTVSVAAGTAATAGTLTVTASGTGVSNATATIGLTTTPAPTGSGDVIYRFCNADTPIWLAVQNGSGAWTRVTGSGGTFAFNITGATGGVAYVQQNGTEFSTSIDYGTKAELVATGVATCPTATAGKTVNGSVAGLGTQDQAFISLGDAATAVSGMSSTFQLTGVADAPRDLVAARMSVTITATGFASALTKVIIRRNQNPANNATLPVLDFNGPEAINPATGTLAIGNLGTDQSLLANLFVTGNGTGTTALLYVDIGGGAASRTYYGVPAANQTSGDLHLLLATALSGDWMNDPVAGATGRTAGVFFSGMGNQSVTLGPVLATPTVSVVSSSPFVRLRTVLPRQTEYNQSFNGQYDQEGSAPRSVVINASAAYQASGNWDFTIPDFAGASYDPNWGLRPGVSVLWVAGASGASIPATATPTAGTTVFSATKAGTLNVPSSNALPIAGSTSNRATARPAGRATVRVPVPVERVIRATRMRF